MKSIIKWGKTIMIISSIFMALACTTAGGKSDVSMQLLSNDTNESGVQSADR